MSHVPPHTITPFDVAALRASAKGMHHSTVGGLALPASIHFDGGVFILATYGRTVAASANAALLVSCLLNENAERGWIARVMDPRADPETALLNLDAYNDRRAQAEANARAITARTEAAAEAARAARRASMYNVSAMDLDDL